MAAATTVTVVLNGTDEALTYSGVQAYEERGVLVVARQGEIIARFELRDLKHWFREAD